MEPYRFRVPEPIEELVRSIHPELKRKVRAALDPAACVLGSF